MSILSIQTTENPFLENAIEASKPARPAPVIKISMLFFLI